MRACLCAALAATLLLAGCSRSRPAPERGAPPPPVQPQPLGPVYALAPTFEANLGGLPWPASGTVTGHFGPRTDPDTRTTVESVGIDVSTAPSAEVIAVYPGTVERVGAMAAFGAFVMVGHEGWTAVYGNLSAIDVRVGDPLEVGHRIGAAGTSRERRGAGVFFALFEGATPVDPLPWLQPR